MRVLNSDAVIRPRERDWLDTITIWSCDVLNLFPWVFMGGVCNSHAIKRYRKIRLFAGLFRADMETPDSETSITTVLERLIKV